MSQAGKFTVLLPLAVSGWLVQVVTHSRVDPSVPAMCVAVPDPDATP